MEAVELVLHLLEKVSVVVSAALVLLLLRPAEVWLGETGSRASVRRRVFLVGLLGAMAIWGTFLGFEIDGMQFNIRMVGIIVAGYLGGVWVGLIVGAAAGVLYAVEVPPELAYYVFAASVLDGALAGWWSKRFGTGLLAIMLGALTIQGVHHVGLATVMGAVNFEMAAFHASKITLHFAKITANAVGITLFMGLLNLFRELEHARREAQSSRDLARSARLEALQYQLKPHFLFNLLNTLAYLIRTDPVRARELTLDLSEFLRYTLARENDETTLRDELKQIERYVDLERARFGDGLNFEITGELDEQCAQLLVPPLILQPLVENAIRHGSKDARVRVSIEVVCSADSARIRVLDDGPGPGAHSSARRARPTRSGVGLQNVQERLERFYIGQATLKLSAREDAPGACAEFCVPLSFGRQRRSKLLEVISDQRRERA
ncbi:MAG: histidine kinase [Bradymonadaceae bacterium]|nr:histidine kinase [Lujinxingiaceae bacterium]